MERTAPREVIESLGAFLRRSTALTDDAIQLRMKDIEEGHMRTLDASSWSLRGPLVRQATVRAPIAFPEHALEAAEVPPDDVRGRLDQLKDHFVAQLQAGELPCFDLPDLHGANGIYDPRGNVFLGPNVRRLAFDRRGAKAFLRLLLALEAASDNLRNGVCLTKRGLYYYQQTKLPDQAASQIDSDRAIAALANMLGVRRKSLGFVEACRGLVWGRLVIRDGGQIVDLSQLGPGGRSIPRFTDDFEIVSSDAAFILVVEKGSVAFAIAQARWWEAARCILVSGEGFPALSTREFVRALVDRLGIPAKVLTDADPAGIQVALTYAHGSLSTALETPWLACNDVWWAGLHPSDVDRYCRSSERIPLSEADLESARRLLEHPSRAYVNDRVREELGLLVDSGAKVELDALSQETSRLFDDYLPKKLFDSELVKL
jgi:DNA topoisomerase-6 subunit A